MGALVETDPLVLARAALIAAALLLTGSVLLLALIIDSAPSRLRAPGRDDLRRRGRVHDPRAAPADPLTPSRAEGGR